MKFFLDNNLSPLLARALHHLSQAEAFPVEVVHLRDRFQRDAEDATWIAELAREGGWIVISQDRLPKNDLERRALRDSKLTVFTLQRQWASAKHWDKSQNLVRWWPAIIEQAALVQGGAAFRVPWGMRGKGQFQQIRL